MQRRWAVLALGTVLSTVAAQAAADTLATTDPRDAIGRHDIVRLVVDNDGPLVSVTVKHRGAVWKGDVRLGLNVAGDRRPEFTATIPHRLTVKPVFTEADGTRWACRNRVARSAASERVTTLQVPRSCVDGADRLAVTAVARSAGRRSDIARSGPVAQQSRPNVMMIMVDDMRTDDLKYMPWTRKLIGGQGVTFANSIAPYPLCCPARASVLTGYYAHNHKVWSHTPPWGFPSFDDHSTVATWLSAAGYQTTYIGKYLNGYGNGHEPGAPEGTTSTQYVPPGWDDWRASIDGGLPAGHPAEGGTYRYFDTTLNHNGNGYDNYRGEYQTRVYGRLATEVINQRTASAKPFFFYLSFSAPHHGMPVEDDDPATVYDDNGNAVDIVTPAVPGDRRGAFDDQITAAPGADWQDPDGGIDKPDYLSKLPPLNSDEKSAILEAARQRAEAVSVVDDQVKRVVTALDNSGELDDTLLMFTSDNGYFLGEQKIRQGKILPYEPSLRTPLMMRGPGIPAGQVRYDPFLSIDFAPTIAQIAGVRPGLPVDGKSMLGVARTGDRGWTRPVLTESGPGSVVRNTDEAGEDLQTGGVKDIRFVIGVRTDRYLYTSVAHVDAQGNPDEDQEELYDLAVDPRQYTNLVVNATTPNTAAPGYATVLSELREQLKRVRACDASQCRVSLPADLATSPGQATTPRPEYLRGR